MDIDGYNQVNLTNNSSRNDIQPQFSPDGLQVVFTSIKEDNMEIYIMELEWYGGYTRYKGINQMNLSNHAGVDKVPQFSLDGLKIIAFFIILVGAAGFEPATLWSQTRCATRLRYAPIACFYSVYRSIYQLKGS